MSAATSNTAMIEFIIAFAKANTCTLKPRFTLIFTCVKKLTAENTTKEKTRISSLACLSFFEIAGCNNSGIIIFFAEDKANNKYGYH